MDNLLEYDNLIYSIINKYISKFDKDDLYQVGMIGLIDAFKHYDSSFDTKFSTFAYYYILGEVNKYIRESSSFKVSKDILRLGREIFKAKEIMSQRLGRNATNLEVALYLEVDEDRVNEALNAIEIVSSLDYENEEGVDLYNFVKVEEKAIAPDILDLKDELNNLNDEEKSIIIARYYNDMTQMEVSKCLGMSQVQVSRKENKILEKLRCRL